MATLRTNSRKFRNNFEIYLTECISNDDFASDDAVECLNYFWSYFGTCANYPANKRRHPNLQNRVANFLRGLPFGFAFSWEGIKEDGIRLGVIDNNVTDEAMNTYIYTWFDFLAYHILKLSERNHINIWRYA